MTRPVVMFRFDSSSAIGRGHAVRSLALASHLVERGFDVHVVTRRLPGSLDPAATDSRLQVHELPPGDQPSGDSPWILDQRNDVDAVMHVIGHVGPPAWVVVDHYGLGAEWEREVRAAGPRIAVIDDLDRPHDADLVIDPNAPRPAPTGGHELLAGPMFALLRPGFAHARGRPSSTSLRVLLCLGGSDVEGRTLQLAGALLQHCPGVHIDVVVTSGNPSRPALDELAERNSSLTVGVDVEDMADRMSAATVMVGAAGSMTWERACVGLPAVVVTTAENQRSIAATIQRARAGVHLGPLESVDPDTVATTTRALLDRPSLLDRIARRALELCDGRGVDRVAAVLGVPLHITILSDASTWLNDRLGDLTASLERAGHTVRHVHEPDDLETGDVALLLGCGSLVGPRQLALHAHNLVVHESDLPSGRGWSPMTWQVLEGVDHIRVSLLEAADAVDAGPIYSQTSIELDGHELVDEIRALQADATIELCLDFIAAYPAAIMGARPQRGCPSYYPRRTPADSELDPDKTLDELFPLFRVVDNERYPAHFEHRGHRYRLRIEKFDE